ncbi:hypothetical protein D3C85_1649370 [compost metagenome]
MRQESVLLCFIEAVDLIYEKNGSYLEIPILACMLNIFLDIFFTARDSRELNKLRFDLLGNDSSEGSFTASRRPP